MRYFLFLLGTLFFVSCEYEPKDNIYKEVDKNGRQVVTINLADAKDTIILDGTTYFKLDYNLGSLNYWYALIYVDSLLIDSLNYDHSEFFTIDPKDFDYGYKTLKVKAVTNSGTNSLADLNSAESMTTTKKWVLGIDNYPIATHMLDVKAVDGKIKFTWNKYTRLKFESYLIYSNTVGVGDGMVYLKEIPNRGDTVFTDDYYVGGNTVFGVCIKVKEQYSPMAEIVYLDSTPGLYPLQVLADNKIKLTWSKCRYPGNFNKYSLSRSYFNNADYFESSDINDTSAVFDNFFGQEYFLSLVVSSKEHFPNWDLYSKELTYSWGERSNNFRLLAFSNDSNIYYLLNDWGQLQKINRADETIIKTWENGNQNDWSGDMIHLDVSADNKYVGYSIATGLYILNAPDLSFRKYISYGSYMFGSINMLDQNLCLINSDCQTPTTFLYDFVSEDTIINTGFRNKGMIVSKDGTFIFDMNDSSVYQLDNKTLTKISTIDGSFSWYNFNPINSTQLICWKDNKLTVFNDIHNLANQNVYDFPYLPGNIDQITGRLGGYTELETEYAIIDINSGQILKKIPIRTCNCLAWLPHYYLFANCIYSASGFKLRVE